VKSIQDPVLSRVSTSSPPQVTIEETSSQAPLITVIIPTYNRAGLLGRAIRSVLKQSFERFELIVADDSSTDATEAVVSRFSDPRIVFIRRSTNGGNAAARNTGILAARGEYICFLDSDDEFLPGYFEAVTTVLEDSPEGVGFAWVGRYLVTPGSDGDEWITERPPPGKDVEDEYLSFLYRFRGGTSRGLVVKRRCFEEIGLFDERLRAAVDTDLVLRLVQRYSYIEIETPYVCFHQHAGERVSQNSSYKAHAYTLLIEKHRAALEANPDLWVQFHNRTARFFYQAGDRASGRSYAMAALKRNRLHLRSWALMLLHEVLGYRGGRLYREMSRFRKRRRGAGTADASQPEDPAGKALI
jgi:glycosyltransferase involved in cell wall biosynthesis